MGESERTVGEVFSFGPVGRCDNGENDQEDGQERSRKSQDSQRKTVSLMDKNIFSFKK